VTSAALGLDPAAVELYLYGERILLPLREFQLLHLLMKNAGRVLTRQQINRPRMLVGTPGPR